MMITTKNFAQLLGIILLFGILNFSGCHRPANKTDGLKTPQFHIQKAGDWHKAGNTQKALDYLSEQIKKAPSQTVLFLVRGKILLEAGYVLSARDDFRRVYRDQDYQTIEIVKILIDIELENANFSQALEIIKKALEATPNKDNLWFHRARMETKLYKFHEAESSILKAVKLNNGNLEYHQYFVNLLALLKKEGEIKAHLLKLHKQFPDDAWVNLRLSSRLINQGETEKAKNILIRALRSNPRNHLLMFQMATISGLENKWGEAIKYLEDGLTEKPSATWIKVRLAKICLKTNQINKAVIYLKQAVKEKTSEVFVYLTLASLYNQQNNTFEAEKLLRLGLAIDDDNQGLILEYAALQEKQADFKEAVKIYTRALLNEPDNNFILGKLGRLHLLMDNRRQALQHLSRTTEIKPSESWILYYYIEALIQTKKWTKAKSEIEKLLGLEPESPWAYAKKTIVEYKLKDYPSALRSINKAVELNPEQSWLMEIKGEILEIMGKTKEALTVYRQILQISPRNPNILVKTAYIQYGSDKAKALENLDNALAYQEFDLSVIEFYLFITDQARSVWNFKHESEEYKTYQNIIKKNYEKADRLLEGLKSEKSSHFPFLEYFLNYCRRKTNLKIQQEGIEVRAIKSAWRLFYLGVDFLNRKDYTQAVDRLEKALKQSPNNRWIISKLALAYQGMKLHKKAVNLLENFLANQPKYNYIWIQTKLALNYDLDKQDKKAEKIYKEILSQNADNHIALNNLAWMYLTSDDPEIRKPAEALSLSEKAVSLHSSTANLDTLAEALYQTQNYRQALKIIEQALAKDREEVDDLKKTKDKILRALKKNN